MVVGTFFLFSCFGAWVLWRAWRVQAALTRELRTLHAALAEAKQLLERRAVLADELAHEVKNPLSAVVCSAEALELLAGNNLPPDQRRCLGLIREFSDHVLRLVSDFLDLSRVEGGRVTPEPENVDIRRLIEGLKDLVGPSAARRGIALTVECTDEMLIAHCDPRHVKQVLFNLLQNALKFTPAGGAVRIGAAVHEGTAIAIRVDDTGVGIDPDHIAHIFEPYVSKTPQSVGDHGERGVGIGLAVCRSLVYLNGGDIVVESSPGKGSCFTIVLPLGEVIGISSHSKAFRSRAKRAECLRGTRVLLCEEDRGSSEATTALLTAWGAMVDRVDSAAELVRCLGETRYDTVLASRSAILSLGEENLKAARASGARLVATLGAGQDAQADCGVDADLVLSGPLDGEQLLSGLETLYQSERQTISPA